MTTPEKLSARIGLFVGQWIAEVARPDAELAPTTEWANLMREVEALETEVESLNAFYRGVNEALNSGDGSYRP